MRVAMIGHKQIPSRSGGVEIVVEKLSEQLVQKGISVDVYNRRKKGIEKIDQYKGITMYYSFTISKRNLDAIISAFFSTAKVIFRPYDILHYHAVGSCLMLWLPRLFHKRIVVTIHGLDWKRAKWGNFASKMLLLGEKFAVKYADQIIVLSEQMKAYFKKNYGRDTIYIPNGIEQMPAEKADIIQKKFGLEKESYILFLARIVPEKGLHYLIEAYKRIKTENKLVIAGDCSYAEDYGKWVKKLCKNCENIIFTGFVDGKILRELYSNATIYVLPSEVEGMPLSLLEAMSYGKCCLVSDIPENTSVAEGFAESFRASDIEDLTQKLEKLLCDSEKRKKLGTEAQKYVLNKYDWSDIAERTLNVYESK